MIPEQADGVPACKKLIERIQKGETEANFFEGMACNGGCVGGPKIIIKKTGTVAFKLKIKFSIITHFL